MVTNERMKVVSQKKQRYRANIAGKTYTILGTKSHQHMHSVIKLLNEQWNKRQSIALERKEQFEKQFAEQEDLWRK